MWAVTCPKFLWDMSNPEARKRALLKGGRCFVCLKKHHMAMKCRSPLRFSTCNGRHHSSICSGTTQGTSPSGALSSRQMSSTQPLSSPHLTTLSMYIDTKNPVLLQTATATVYSADRSYATTVIRLILDSSSQKSYITNKLRDSRKQCRSRRSGLKLRGWRPVILWSSNSRQRWGQTSSFPCLLFP